MVTSFSITVHLTINLKNSDLHQEVHMTFDFITWGIWSLGFIILVVWSYISLKEFVQILRRRKGQ